MTRFAIPAKEFLMRYSPAAVALSLLLAVSSSVSYSAPTEKLDPRAAALLEQGRAVLASGQTNDAIDAYESALVVSPGHISVLLELALATRKQGMQGKALHYYREALEADPRNLAAIAGEGATLAEKGALEKARRNLARLRGMCGRDCTETRQLAAFIAKGPPPRVVTADALKPDPVVSEN